MGGGVSKAKGEETPLSDLEEMEFTKSPSPKSVPRITPLIKESSGSSLREAVSRTIHKIHFVKTSSKVYSEVSEENSIHKRTIKTPRTVSTSKSRNTSTAESSTLSNKRPNQTGMTTQPSRLSYGSIDMMSENYINYPVGKEIFSKLHEGSAIFGTNKHARNAFIKFIKGKSWMDQLMRPLAILNNDGSLATSSKEFEPATQLGGEPFFSAESVLYVCRHVMRVFSAKKEYFPCINDS